jgi:hypothetical protein
VVEFKIGSEIIGNHVQLLIAIENMLQRKVNRESIVEETTHKLVKYMWEDRAKSES